MNRKSGCQCSQGWRIQQPSSLITNHVYLHVPAPASWCLLHPEPGNPFAVYMHHIVWVFCCCCFYHDNLCVLLVNKIKFKNIFKSYWVILYFERTLQFYKGLSQQTVLLGGGIIIRILHVKKQKCEWLTQGYTWTQTQVFRLYIHCSKQDLLAKFISESFVSNSLSI